MPRNTSNNSQHTFFRTIKIGTNVDARATVTASRSYTSIINFLFYFNFLLGH